MKVQKFINGDYALANDNFEPDSISVVIPELTSTTGCMKYLFIGPRKLKDDITWEIDIFINENGGPDIGYWFNNSGSIISKEEFVNWLIENDKDSMLWFLFHPEIMSGEYDD